MNFRRYYIPNSLVFITTVVERREPIFAEATNITLLRKTLRNVKELHPFAMIAYSFLPDHLHLLIRPTAASNYSKIMQSFKTNFAKEYKTSLGISGNMKFWQKRFRDHIIRDENDLRRHIDYIHYNPVRHGMVARPEDWEYSSFLEWWRRGAYPEMWGWALPDTLIEVNLVDYD